jgi:hypothetical protein
MRDSKRLGGWQKGLWCWGLQTDRQKHWKGCVVIFDDTVAHVLQRPQPHTAFITCGSVAQCASRTALSHSSDIITYTVALWVAHDQNTQVPFSVSRSSVYGKKHNSVHSYTVGHFFMTTSLTAFFFLFVSPGYNVLRFIPYANISFPRSLFLSPFDHSNPTLTKLFLLQLSQFWTALIFLFLYLKQGFSGT